MKQVVAYIRVSTDQQGKSGLDIEAQRAAIAQFVEVEGCELEETYEEVETAKGADALDRRASSPPPLLPLAAPRVPCRCPSWIACRVTWRSYPA